MKNCLRCFLVVDLLAAPGALADNATTDKWGAVTNDMQMSISLKSGEKEIKTNQPVELAIRLRNLSTNATFWISLFDADQKLGGLSFVVTSPSGKDASVATKSSSGRVVRVAPSRTRQFEFDLSCLYKFNEVGNYQITAKFGELMGVKKKFEVISNPLSLGVVSGR